MQSRSMHHVGTQQTASSAPPLAGEAPAGRSEWSRVEIKRDRKGPCHHSVATAAINTLVAHAVANQVYTESGNMPPRPHCTPKVPVLCSILKQLPNMDQARRRFSCFPQAPPHTPMRPHPSQTHHGPRRHTLDTFQAAPGQDPVQCCTIAQMESESGDRAKYRKLAGSMLLRELRFKK